MARIAHPSQVGRRKGLDPTAAQPLLPVKVTFAVGTVGRAGPDCLLPVQRSARSVSGAFGCSYLHSEAVTAVAAAGEAENAMLRGGSLGRNGVSGRGASKQPAVALCHGSPASPPHQPGSGRQMASGRHPTGGSGLRGRVRGAVLRGQRGDSF